MIETVLSIENNVFFFSTESGKDLRIKCNLKFDGSFASRMKWIEVGVDKLTQIRYAFVRNLLLSGYLRELRDVFRLSSSISVIFRVNPTQLKTF